VSDPLHQKPAGHDWRFYLGDMLRFCRKVQDYTEGLNQDAFEQSDLRFDATLRNLELIGEAATHIPEAVRERYPDIPWRMIVATRNKLIHGYLGIDNDIIWSIVIDELPGLISKLEVARK
jgi:uncharacterized protein with HEPN domain